MGYAGSGRALYIDNLRWVVILSVITVHAAVTYGPVGGWFYHDRSQVDTLSDIVLTAYPAFLQAFFMGLLFLVAGYFVPRSFDRRGASSFTSERAKRLIVPALFFMLLIAPLTIYFLFSPGGSFLTYYVGYVASPLQWDSGPLWFTLALFVCTCTYIAYRLVFKARTASSRVLDHRLIASLTVMIILSTFLVRLIYPIGSNVWNMQLCFFPQYIALFAFGLLAYRNDWFNTLSWRTARVWFWSGIVLSLTLWPALMVMGGALGGDFSAYAGGMNWQTALLIVWEETFCIGVCLGLLVIFRDRYNRQGRTEKVLSDNAFSVYVFHAPVVIGLAMILAGVALYPLAKFVLLSVLSITITLAFCVVVVRRIPYLKDVL